MLLLLDSERFNLNFFYYFQMDQNLQILALSSTKARLIREGSVRIGSEMKSNTFFSVQSIVSFNI